MAERQVNMTVGMIGYNGFLLQGGGRPYYVDVNQNMKRVWLMFM